MPTCLKLHNASLLHQFHILPAMQAGKLKVEVPELVPSTAEEVLEYGLAERRRCHLWQRVGWWLMHVKTLWNKMRYEDALIYFWQDFCSCADGGGNSSCFPRECPNMGRNFRKKREAQVDELVKSNSVEDEPTSLSPKARQGWLRV